MQAMWDINAAVATLIAVSTSANGAHDIQRKGYNISWCGSLDSCSTIPATPVATTDTDENSGQQKVLAVPKATPTAKGAGAPVGGHVGLVMGRPNGDLMIY